jgi:hypothetical protein
VVAIVLTVQIGTLDTVETLELGMIRSQNNSYNVPNVLVHSSNEGKLQVVA